MSVLRERGMVRHFIFQAKATEPSIREVQMNLFTQLSFRTDTKTVTNDEHADHQLRVD